MASSTETDDIHGEEESFASSAAANDVRQQASDCVAVTVVARRPRAIVVLLGWMGAEVQQIDQYAHLYHDLKCSTIAATAPVFSIAVNNSVVLGEVAVTACREAARLVRMGEMSEMGLGTVPLLFHVFGNGGALVLEQVDRTIREWVPECELEDLQRQAQASSCPIPLRRPQFIKAMESMKSLPSLANTSDDSEEEEDLDTAANLTGPVFWVPAVRDPSLPQFSSLNPPPKRIMSFGQCRLLQKQISHHRPCWSPNVRRLDVERSAAFSFVTSTPKYNKEDRAYHRDFSLVASRLFLGGIIFDSALSVPTVASDLAATAGIGNPVHRMLAQSAILGAHGASKLSLSFGEHRPTVGRGRAEGRAAQFWTNMEQLSLSKRHVYVYTQRDYTQHLDELITNQKEQGTKVTECKMEETDRVQRLNQYPEVVGVLLDELAAATLDEDDGWSSDEEVWHSARQI